MIFKWPFPNKALASLTSQNTVATYPYVELGDKHLSLHAFFHGTMLTGVVTFFLVVSSSRSHSSIVALGVCTKNCSGLTQSRTKGFLEFSLT